ATEGSIIAAIMVTQRPRKAGSARPMVPGPLPMLLDSATVTPHNPAATAATAAHGTASWRGGRLRMAEIAVRGSEAGLAWPAMARLNELPSAKKLIPPLPSGWPPPALQPYSRWLRRCRPGPRGSHCERHGSPRRQRYPRLKPLQGHQPRHAERFAEL